MRKIFAIFILLLSSVILLIAMDQSFINRIKQDRYFDHLTPDSLKARSVYHSIFIRSDRWAYGDLYGISYLPQYKFKLSPYKAYASKNDTAATGRLLYIIGDSFTADKVLNAAFPGFDNVVFLDRRFPFGPIKLDTTTQNYLIMEFAELNLHHYSLKNTPETLNTSPQTIAASPISTTSFTSRINKIIFNKDLSKNIELVLFDDKIFSPFKQLKASINYNLLGRVPKEVAVSTDKKRLLLNSTVDVNSPQSDFRNVSDREIDSLTHNLAAAEKYYKTIGFKKVFLSVIPNAVSVYDAKRAPYNNLINRVEQKTVLPVIPAYNLFKGDNRNLYYYSDAHWNPLGFNLWVEETNKILQANLK